MNTKANKDHRTKAELLEEIEQLRTRFDEAEQTLDAIRSGDVDALVVSGPHGDQVFSLTGAERTYRLIVETMNEAALTVAFDGTILFCNQRFLDLVKTPMTSVVGQKLTAFVAPDQQQAMGMLLAETQSHPVQRHLMLQTVDGAVVPTQLSASLLVADTETSICLVASNLAELEAQACSISVLREQQQALEESRAELQAANVLLRDSHLAALNMMEDADIARRRAEEISAELLVEVAERKRAEGWLSEAKRAMEHERDILQAVMSGAKNSHLVYLDRDFNFVRVNDTYARSCGYLPGEMIGRNHFALYPDPGNEAIFARVRDTGESAVYHDKPFVFPNQPERGVTYWDWALTPIKDPEGGVEGLVFSLFETTERKLVEAAIQRSNARLDLLAETAGRFLSSDSPQLIVDELCQKVMSFLDCHVFFNFLVDENDGRLRLNACAGISDEERQKIEWLDYGVAVCGCAARDACRIVAEDIPNTPDPRTELVKSYGIQAYACHPLLVQGEVLGTLSFGTRTRTKFSDDNLALMKAVADQVSIAMERKRAEIELRRAHDELEMRVQERTVELATTVETLLVEIAERERAEASLQRLNSLYTVLSETDQAIIRVTDRDSLFHEFCSIAVQHGGFLLAWVGLVDKEDGKVKIVAANGATAYLDDIRITADDEPTGEGPTGIAIREGTYCISNDFQNDPCTRPWQEKGRAHGICASASIALREDGQVIGALTLYAGARDFFDAQHVALLQQMGADISFALDNFTREARRREMEESLHQETLARLRTVEELREKEQMLIQQSRLAAMGDMINNIAHQWRQPLNVLGLLIQHMQLYYEMGLFNKEYLDENVGKSMDLIKHMSQTIDDFRDFFKPDKDKVEFNVREVVVKTLALVADGFTNQMITINFNDNADPVIFGFPNEYAQVVLNILMNAKDALVEKRPEHATITVTVCLERNRGVVTIADNAGGIPEENMFRVFEPYFTTKGPDKGTGLGLFMSKTIIEKNMGGRLTVRNHGGGAEFRIEV